MGLGPNGEIINRVLTELWGVCCHWRAQPKTPSKAMQVSGCIAIASFKNNPPPNTAPVVDKNTIVLTLKQASIVALKTMAGFTAEACQHGYNIPLYQGQYSQESHSRT